MLQRIAISLGALTLVTSQAFAAHALVLKTDKDKLSYSIGASIGRNFKSDTTDVDLDVLIAGLRASMSGGKLLLADKDIRQIMNDYQVQLRQQATAKRQKAVVENKQKGEAFLADYHKQAGVLASPGGVLYKTFKAGGGNKPLESDTVEVNYRGTLANGTEFDATEPGHPANLKVSALIPGWKQALTMMPVGSKWQIVIPAQLGYGERGVGNDIGPNEVLVFDLELVAIK
jgi:FKBP-type peptidyl-prolyl cis-trans isomerase FklB